MANIRELHEMIGSPTRADDEHYDSHAAIETQQSKIKFYGYGFVILNLVQGFYILGFHCIQNEKVCAK